MDLVKLPRILEPFLPESNNAARSSSSYYNNGTTGFLEWRSKTTKKILNMQTYSVVSIFWLGVFIYGCDLPVKIVLNQISISLYFFLIYSIGLILSFYVQNYVSIAGMRVTALLQCITIFAAGYFEVIGFLALRDHQKHDRYSVTRLLAAAVYTIILLAHFLVFATSLALTVTAIRSSCMKSSQKANTLPVSPTEIV